MYDNGLLEGVGPFLPVCKKIIPQQVGRTAVGNSRSSAASSTLATTAPTWVCCMTALIVAVRS